MLFADNNIGRLILESVMGESTEKRASAKVDVSDIRRISGSLTKVASLPYKEEVYHSVQELVKEAADFLDQSATELESALAKQRELEKAMEMRSVLDDMIHYGILDPEDTAEKVAELSKKSLQEIEIVKTAVDMIKSGKSGGEMFDMSKTASSAESAGKRGMFDGIL